MFLLVRQMVYQPDRFKFGPTDYFCPHISVPKKVLGLSRDSNPGVGVNFLSFFYVVKRASLFSSLFSKANNS